MIHPLYEIVTTTTGAISIRNKVLGETMHNPVGPWLEANRLYIQQSNLEARLLIAPQLVVFDVGLGAAANAIAAMSCARACGGRLHLVSFERDLTLLEFALAHASHFDHFSGYEPALRDLLRTGHYQDDLVTWDLRHGDFLECIDHESTRPHLVYYDPYSPKVNQEMWTTACFKKLRSLARDVSEGGTILFTYSLATRIRTALLEAGFFVGYGQATGLKTETTQAATWPRLLERPLGVEWWDRWRRSHVRYPFGSESTDHPRIDQIVDRYFSLCPLPEVRGRLSQGS